MTALRMFVPGLPAAEGSVRGFQAGARTVVVHDNKASLGVWRHAVTSRAAELWGDAPPLDVAVGVDVCFHLPRPPSTPKRRIYPQVRPDVDKLGRAVLDALTGVVFVDDARVVELRCRKVYAVAAPPGADVRVWAMSADQDRAA